MLMTAIEYRLLRSAECKLKRGEPLAPAEQEVVNKYGVAPEKLCGYKGCKNPLGPRVDGERRTIGEVEVCDDCYFGELGDALESFPIVLGVRRRV